MAEDRTCCAEHDSCVEQFAMPNRNCRVQQSIPFFHCELNWELVR